MTESNDYLKTGLLTKVCTKCKETKPISMFSKNSIQCKACQAAYHMANRERDNARTKAYGATHKEELAAYKKAYDEAHREEKRVYQVAYDAARKEERAVYKKAYDEAHKEEKAAYNKIYNLENPEGRRSKKARRRTVELNEMTRQDIKDTVEWKKKIKNDPCFYCGLIKDKMEDDHLIPLSKGGTDHWWNVERACLECNRSKRDKTYLEFAGL